MSERLNWPDIVFTSPKRKELSTCLVWSHKVSPTVSVEYSTCTGPFPWDFKMRERRHSHLQRNMRSVGCRPFITFSKMDPFVSDGIVVQPLLQDLSWLSAYLNSFILNLQHKWPNIPAPMTHQVSYRSFSLNSHGNYSDSQVLSPLFMDPSEWLLSLYTVFKILLEAL